jgi:hypothetical protein
MPLTIGLITLGVGAVGGGAQTLIGRKQKKEAEEALKNQRRPTMGTPQELMEKLALFKNMTAGNMPGYQNLQSIADMNLAAGGGAISRGAQSSQDYMAAMQGMFGQNMMAQQQNAIQNSQFQQNFQTSQREAYAGVLGELAQQRMAEFQFNKVDPYNQARDMYMQNYQAGVSNMNSGINTMIGSAASSAPYMASGHDWDKFGQIMGYGS